MENGPLKGEIHARKKNTCPKKKEVLYLVKKKPGRNRRVE